MVNTISAQSSHSFKPANFNAPLSASFLSALQQTDDEKDKKKILKEEKRKEEQQAKAEKRALEQQAKAEKRALEQQAKADRKKKKVSSTQPPSTQSNSFLSAGELANKTPDAEALKIQDAFVLLRKRQDLAARFLDKNASPADRTKDFQEYLGILYDQNKSVRFCDLPEKLQLSASKDGVMLDIETDKTNFIIYLNGHEALSDLQPDDPTTLDSHIEQKSYPKGDLRKELAQFIRNTANPADLKNRLELIYVQTLAFILREEPIDKFKQRVMEEAKKDGINMTFESVSIPISPAGFPTSNNDN